MSEYAKKVKPQRKIPVVSRYSRWLRLYASVRHDPKILLLSERRRWQWICLLTLAAEAENGVLPDHRTIAVELRCLPDEAVDLCNELVEVGLLTRVRITDPNSPVRIHNWDARQFKSDTSTERSKRHRDKGRPQTDAPTCNVAATLQDRCSDGDATKLQRPDSDSLTSVSVSSVLVFQEEEETLKEDTRASTGNALSNWAGSDDDEVLV